MGDAPRRAAGTVQRPARIAADEHGIARHAEVSEERHCRDAAPAMEIDRLREPDGRAVTVLAAALVKHGPSTLGRDDVGGPEVRLAQGSIGRERDREIQSRYFGEQR